MHNTSIYLPIIDSGYVFVKVRFKPNEGQEYTYKTENKAVEVGDIVIVESRDWYGVATVTQINVPIPMDDTTTQFRWVVQRLYLDDHRVLLMHERDMIAKVNEKRAESMRSQMLFALGLTRDEADKLIEQVTDEELHRETGDESE